MMKSIESFWKNTLTEAHQIRYGSAKCWEGIALGERLLLDCTLRDGGYVNNWEFGYDQIVEIFNRLVSSGVEFIEVGFLDESSTYDRGRTVLPDTVSVNRMFEGIDKGKSCVLGMIDYGACGIERLEPCDETFLDGIRVIFKEAKMKEALAFCAEVKKLGYKVFAQMVSVTTYTDEKLAEYAKLVNEVMPYATSMVDTYGLLDEEHLCHIYGILDANLDPQICVGYHAHNNFQLGYANAKHFLSLDSERGLLADGTLYGMGKSAGNAPLELLLMFRNDKQGAGYHVTQALEAIDNVIMEIYQRQYWGYNLFYYIASSMHCHPNYVSRLMNKRTLSVKQIRDILKTLDPAKSLLYDEAYIERLYREYQSIECDDRETLRILKEKLGRRPLLLLGPARSMTKERAKVKRFIEEKKPRVIAVNYAPPTIEVDAIFMAKSKRYMQLFSDLQHNVNRAKPIVATSNMTKSEGFFPYVLNYGSLIDRDAEIIDNALVMILKAVLRMGVPAVTLAGFDGYSKRSRNYFDENKEYRVDGSRAEYLNKYIGGFLRSISDKIELEFLTKTRYEWQGKDGE